MENSTQVKLFYLFGLQETFNNKSVYFTLSLITYLLIITVNLTLIITIIQQKGLHEPMYIFLCSLCVNGLYGTAGFYPKLLLDLQSDVQVISYGGCLSQTYVIYTSVMCEMSTLTVMSYDRYVAICRPLLYHTIVTSLTVRKLLLFSWCYPLFIGLIVVSLTIRVPLCGSRIDKIFCDIPSILKHACLPIPINQILNKFVIMVHVLPILFIVFSYCQIVRNCVKSAKGRIKFTQTCVPHLLTMVIFITVTLFDNLQGWNSNVNITLNMRNAMAVQFLVIPPVFNPLIYGLNLQQIRSNPITSPLTGPPTFSFSLTFAFTFPSLISISIIGPREWAKMDVAVVDVESKVDGAVDQGGPSREYYRLLMRDIRDSAILEGPEEAKRLSLEVFTHIKV
ncbi:olfactory receptor 1D2-like [Oncorhynchus tshawytscha]|uniref:olfactory receptor 1D2-like n=1 Tax=Oncorhynchus tshawytscha TaxID=74940 RepID=UPI001C3E6E1C|nr:olfactory receptor 1D2-like [Oncorhynchus tshawytscha]